MVDRILSFDFDLGAPCSYEGVVSRDATEAVGTFKQGPTAVPLSFAHTDAKPEAASAKPVILSRPGRKLELQPCGVAGITKDALCAQYEVYEDRARKSGRKNQLECNDLARIVRRAGSGSGFLPSGRARRRRDFDRRGFLHGPPASYA
jgi:hypothetical protein